MPNTDTHQTEVPAYKVDNAQAGESLVDLINRWDKRVGMKKLEKGGKFLGYVGMAKYPWNLAKANLAKHWHDQDVMVVIFHNVKQAVKELEEKKKENDLTKQIIDKVNGTSFEGHRVAVEISGPKPPKKNKDRKRRSDSGNSRRTERRGSTRKDFKRSKR